MNHIKLFACSILIFVTVAKATAQSPVQTVWLDQLDLSAGTQGYGTPKKNRSIDGKPMTIAGSTFERGFGTHAESSLII